MATSDLENDQYVQRWLTGLAPRTKKNYLREFPLWVSFVKMTPTQQIDKRLEDLTSKNLIERTFFENKFREYKEMLEISGRFNALSVQTMLRTVASFFGRNSLSLDLKKDDWKSTLQTKVVQRFELNIDDVKRMYGHANLRDKILLLCLGQSGFSEIDASVLSVDDIKDLYSLPVNEHYFIEKPREKTGFMQATCLSFEFLHDLRDYLAEQGNPSNGYIFTSQTKNTEGKPLEVRQINQAMKNLATRTFGEKKGAEFETKALRSFYNSALLRANIQPQELKDLLMGHARTGARSHYSYDSETVKQAYLKAFEFLSINGIQSREDLAKIKQDMKRQEDYLLNIITELKVQTKQQNERLDAQDKSINGFKEFEKFVYAKMDEAQRTFEDALKKAKELK